MGVNERIPKQMLALVAQGFGESVEECFSKVQVQRVPIPRPKSGQVLIKVHAAPCNPADLLYLRNQYVVPRPDFALLGGEGSGTVVAAGTGLIGRWLMGKRVAFGGTDVSSWAEYSIANARLCVPLRDDLSLEQGATALGNPLTALALTKLISDNGHKTFVQTAAAGQLGRMILTAANDRGLVGIHVVRRTEQVRILQQLGAEHILVSECPDYEKNLKELAARLGARVALDAVAGASTGQLVNNLPASGEVIVYGALSGQACGGFDPMVLAAGAKSIRGFEIASHATDLGLVSMLRLANQAQKRVAAGLATTGIRRQVSLAQAPEEILQYRKSMSDGKVLLMPSWGTEQ